MPSLLVLMQTRVNYQVSSHITKNGEGDGVFMNIDAFERREQALELRAKIMQAEEERLSGARTRSISEARRELRARAETI